MGVLSPRSGAVRLAARVTNVTTKTRRDAIANGLALIDTRRAASMACPLTAANAVSPPA